MNDITNKVRRGEIYLHDFGVHEGSVQNGVRPVLVIQCDQANSSSTTTVVAALTSVIKKRYLPSHVILGENFGLKEPSMVMLEQLQTVNQSNLIKKIGEIDSQYMMRKINTGLKKAVGLWIDRPPKPKSDIRCLCPNCLEGYINHPDYIVKRLDPFAKEKQHCDKCGESGWEYILIERQKAHAELHTEERIGK